MADELFRQDSGHGTERAKVQGEGAQSVATQQGPKLEADFYRDRFQQVDRRDLQDNWQQVPEVSQATITSARQLKEEIAAIAEMPTMTWNLPEWQPAVVSRELLARLKAVSQQLKVVSGAADSLNEQVEALYAVETEDTDAAEDTEEEAENV